MADIQIHYGTNGTVALYTGGFRSHVGDEESVRRALILTLGITEVHEDYFLQGQETYAGTAQTTAAIRAYKVASNAAHAAELRAQAQILLDEAAELLGEDV